IWVAGFEAQGFKILPENVPRSHPDVARTVRRGIEGDSNLQFLLLAEKLHALVRYQLGADGKHHSGRRKLHDHARQFVRTEGGIGFHGSDEPGRFFSQDHPRSKHRIAADIPYRPAPMFGLVADIFRLDVIITEEAMD